MGETYYQGKTAAGRLPTYLYHGTSEKAWSENRVGNGRLYLAVDPEDSSYFAQRAAQQDGSAPIIFKIPFQTLCDSPITRMVADEDVDGTGDFDGTWGDSLEIGGLMAVVGDIEGLKPKFCVAERLTKKAAALNSLFFVPIPLGALLGKSNRVVKTSATVSELVSATNSFSVKRRPGCEASLINSNPKELYLQYKVRCKESYSDPKGHDVRIKFDVSKVEETQNANDLDVQLNCGCPAFLYYGAQWNLHQRDALLGTPRPELIAPTQRLDLRGNFILCKHAKTVVERILPSVQHNIINIVREITVRKNKEQLKQRETPERLKTRQEDMKKQQEIKKIRKLKNKEIQKKLLDALRRREEEESVNQVQHEEDKSLAQEGINPDIIRRDEPATMPAPVVEAPEKDGVTEKSPEGEEDLTAMTEQEEQKLREEHHKKIKNQPHLHKGLPYEDEKTKEEHGHDVPTDEELMDVLKGKKQQTNQMRDFVEKKLKRKQTSLELSLLAAVAEGDNG